LFKTTDATESKTYQNIKHDIIWQLALTVMLQYKCIYSAHVRSVRRNMNLKGWAGGPNFARKFSPLETTNWKQKNNFLAHNLSEFQQWITDCTETAGSACLVMTVRVLHGFTIGLSAKLRGKHIALHPKRTMCMTVTRIHRRSFLSSYT